MSEAKFRFPPVAGVPILEAAMPEWYYEPAPGELFDPIDPELFKVLTYQNYVEDQTADYSLFAELIPELRADIGYVARLDAWRKQEGGHGQQLWVVRKTLNPNIPSREAERRQQVMEKDQIARHFRPIGAMALGYILGGQRAAAVIASRGMFNEMTTRDGYAMTRELADNHPLLDKTLTPIGKEESLHVVNYRDLAEKYLDGSPKAQRAARFLLEHMKTMVGEGYQGTAEADFVIRKLFGSRRAKDVAERIDDEMAGLPGFKGFSGMRRRVHAALS